MFASAVTVPDELEPTLMARAEALGIPPADVLQIIVRESLMDSKRYAENLVQAHKQLESAIQGIFDRHNLKHNDLFKLKLIKSESGATASYLEGIIVVNLRNPSNWSLHQFDVVMETLMRNAVKTGNIRP